MKTWQYLTVFAILMAILFGLFTYVPQGEFVRNALWKGVVWTYQALVFTFALTVLFVGPGVVAFVVRHWGMPWIDDQMAPDKNLSRFQSVSFAVAMALIAGLAWIILTPVLVGPWSWLHDIAKDVGWSGYFETPPVGWGIWGAAAYLIGWAVSWLASDA